MTYPQQPGPQQWPPPQQHGYHQTGRQPGYEYPGYPGHQYPGHQYPGHQFRGQPQPGQQYFGYGQHTGHPTAGYVTSPYQQQAPSPRKRRTWPWIVGGAVALVVLVSAVSGGAGGEETATLAGETFPVAPAAPAIAAPAPQVEQAQPAAPEPPPAPIVIEGKGDDVVTLDKPDGVAVVDFECSRCSQNVIVQTDGAETLLVNTIGAYRGRHLIDTSSTSRTGTITVTAKGSWKITVTPGLSSLRRSNGEPISGEGDDVVLVAGATSKAAVTYRGDQNFIVMAIGEYTDDLLINEIGSYEGTVPLRGPAVAVVISSGDWTITPS